MRDVSIIIPAHIRSEEELGWLEECIESALVQDCEIVVYNDGSPIDPYELLTKYPVIYEHGERKHGAAYARNRAAELATKELILPLDCDDRLVDGAVDKLLSVWDGEVPVYPDVSKFGDVYDEHYVLLDFNCNHVYTYVGFSSVNVLHKRAYWVTLRGWDEGLEFYEDGEYNARLFSQWCGKRYPEPLVEYRQHDTQRTKLYKKQSSAYSKLILSRSRRLIMACKGCGGKNAPKSMGAGAGHVAAKAQTVEEAIAMASTMPGEIEGRVLAVYIGGKGMGKHYYQGPGTKFPYKVLHGGSYYVDSQDTDESNMNSLFKKQKGQEVEKVAEPKKASEKKPQVSRTARISPDKKPVEAEDLPDLFNLSYKEIRELKLDADTALKLLKAEKRGKRRKQVIEYLENLVKK
jgi:hypothetical protein